MGKFSLREIKWDKNYIIVLLSAFLLAIICGIVLYKIANISFFFEKYAHDYVACVFAFESGRLLATHALKELFYLYAFFAVARFTRFKAATAVIIFIRTLVCVFYCAVLFGSLGFGGVCSAVIIFIPCSLASAVSCWFVAECCRSLEIRHALLCPAAFALANCLLMMVLLHVVFRILIVIV